MDEATSAAPRYSRTQVDNCAFAAWYPSFEHVSIKSVIVPLPPAFVSLILADGVVLPDALKAQEQQLALQSVRAQVETVLRRFKGKVFPKLNWTSPRDASWMLGTMQCVNFEDVFLLLKSSDFAVHDMTEAYAGCQALEDDANGTAVTQQTKPLGPESVYLVLKKWCSFFDSMLFRCFVVNNALVGVSQRNCDEYFPFLFDQQDHLCERIYSFFDANFRKQSGNRKSAVFPDPDFIFDVYVDKQHRVYLLDINVFGAVTDPLLFSWEELLELRGAHERSTALKKMTGDDEDSDEDDDDDVHEVVDFRIVESELSIRPNPLSGYRVPTDLVDHLAGGAGFEAFMEQVKKDNAQDDSSSEDDAQEQDDDDDDGVLWGSDNDD